MQHFKKQIKMINVGKIKIVKGSENRIAVALNFLNATETNG